MSCVAECRKYLKQKISNRPFENFEKEHSSLLRKVKRTIEFGESNSVIVIGRTGVGKTMLVESVLNEITNTVEYEDRHCIVWLHGLIHSTDHLAFQDICEQMDVNLESDEDTSEDAPVSKDVLSKLLLKLSATEDNNVRAVIFVLENFEAFCQHGEQSLLYILFDTAQAKKIPVFVIGITSYIGVLELLEKRLQSRFSGNQILMFPKHKFEDRMLKFSEILTLEKNSCSDPTFVDRWNKNIKKLSSDLGIVDLMKKLFSISRNERYFTNFLLYSVAQINEKNSHLTKNNLETAFEMLNCDSKVGLLKSLSTLQFCLIIAAYHQTTLYDDEPFNFEMVYQRYHKVARRASCIPCVQRQMAYQIFETLIDLELIAPYSASTAKSIPREYIFHRLLVSKHDVKEAVRTYPNLLADIQQWAENSLS